MKLRTLGGKSHCLHNFTANHLQFATNLHRQLDTKVSPAADFFTRQTFPHKLFFLLLRFERASFRLNIINENLISNVINFVWLFRTKMCFSLDGVGDDERTMLALRMIQGTFLLAENINIYAVILGFLRSLSPSVYILFCHSKWHVPASSINSACSLIFL